MIIFNFPSGFFSNIGRKFGLSPYTLLVDIKIKGALGQYDLVNSKRLRVPFALISKSINGLSLAQS